MNSESKQPVTHLILESSYLGQRDRLLLRPCWEIVSVGEGEKTEIPCFQTLQLAIFSIKWRKLSAVYILKVKLSPPSAIIKPKLRLKLNTKFSFNRYYILKHKLYCNTLLSWSCIRKCCLSPPVLKKYMWNNTFKNFKLLCFGKEPGNVVGNYSILATHEDECLVLSVPYSGHAVS